MSFFTDYKKYSYEFSQQQKLILKNVVSLVQDSLPFSKKPSKLLDELKICWAPMMYLEDEHVYGMWSFLSKSQIYIRPAQSKWSSGKLLYNKGITLKRSYREKLQTIALRPVWTDVYLKNDKSLDKYMVELLLYLLQGSGHTTTTALHQLWHRQQYITRPIWYLVSCLATNLIDYDRACQCQWSIQHDVRQKVDNYQLKKKMADLYIPVYQHLYLIDKSQREDLQPQERVQVEEQLKSVDQTTAKLISLVKKPIKQKVYTTI